MSESNTEDDETTTVRKIGDLDDNDTVPESESSEGSSPTSGDADPDPSDLANQPSLFDRDPEDIDPEEIKRLPDTVKEAVMNPDSKYRGYFDTDEESPPQETQGDSDATSDDDDEDIPEPNTLTETGLVDDDGEFDWEDSEDGFLTDAEVSFGQGDEGDKFFYSGVPFELEYPSDDQKMENASRHLEGLQDESDSGRQKAARLRYMRELSEACYTVRGVPLEKVYLKDQRPIANVDGKALEDDSDATPIWSAATELDKTRLGTRAHNFVEGTTKFRPR